MALLLIGLALFLGAHSVQIVAPGLRGAVIGRLGANGWRGLYSAIAGVGFVLLIVGYGQARGADPLWARPAGAEHLTASLVLLGFILIVAAYWPGNHIKSAVKDPMVLGVAAWAAGHLAVKATPAALALFGGFLAWAALDFVSLRMRPAGPAGPPPKWTATLGVVAAGAIVFAVFAFYLHGVLIGVRPFG